MTDPIFTQVEALLAAKLHPLNQVLSTFTVYMDMPEEAAVADTLFVALSHVQEQFDTTAYININAPTHESGKTRLTEILENLVNNPQSISFASKAAIIRIAGLIGPKKDGEKRQIPCLILDEADTSLKSDEITGILNSGFKKGKTMPLNVPVGVKSPRWETVQVDTFGPKIITGIGKLANKALASRCIENNLLRRRTGKTRLPRFGDRQKAALAPIVVELKEWLATVEFPNYEELPFGFSPEELGDRQADMWEPLFLIADAAGGDWPVMAREAAKKLHNKVLKQYDPTESILRDIQTAFGELQTDFLSTAELVTFLSTEDYEWGLYRNTNGISWSWNPEVGDIKASILIAQLLRPLKVEPKQVRRSTGSVSVVVRGYRLEQFRDLWDVYGI